MFFSCVWASALYGFIWGIQNKNLKTTILALMLGITTGGGYSLLLGSGIIILIEKVRYYIALVIFLGLPASILIWLIIHPLAKSLRRVGITWAYTIVAVPIMLWAGMAIWFRDIIFTTDYEANYLLMTLSIIPFAISTAFYRIPWKYPVLQIQVGIPELLNRERGLLLTDGIYSRIRHPKYVESSLWLLGFALLTNYLAMYLAFLITLPIIHIVVLLEEKELNERFGADYEAYCRQVPRYIPKVTYRGKMAA